MDNRQHEIWMKEALQEAEKALCEDEIPVGAVLVRNNEIVYREHNRTRQLSDPTAHCERLIIEKAVRTGQKYLQEHTLYVTLEPCPMCAGMLVLARIGSVVFGCYDPKTGAVGSLYNIPADKQLNHNPEVIGGILNEECSLILRQFFTSKRG